MTRRIFAAGYAIVLLVALCAGGSVSAQTSATATAPINQRYIVQAGDNLSRIAQRFGVSMSAIMSANGITDPNVIRLGQELIIPVAGSATGSPIPTVSPTTTPPGLDIEPTAVFDTVLSGDTLASIARRNATTLEELIRLNNIVNPDLILVGQRIIVRAGRVTPTLQPGQTADDADPAPFGVGLSIFVQDQPPSLVVEQVSELPLDWVKIDVEWSGVEPSPGVYNFVVLDEAVNALNRINVRVLLTITGTPVWARSITQEDGPPDNFEDFASFAASLSEHFAGRVAAYQIWNEPNLRRQWSSDRHRIDPASYFELLRLARIAINAADPTALIISAGLAPTGFNDGVNALNDRLYLQSLYDLGLMTVTDAVAVHAVGFANPPDSDCCQKSDGVETHFENRSFYFKNTLQDYRQIMESNGDSRPIWITKFGWGTSEDTVAPGESFVYVTYNSLVEQATYIPGAFNLARSLGYVGPMFLFNFNGCQFTVARPEECYFSLLGPSGAPRAAFNTLRAMR